ncbi:calcium and integrin-binding family member 2-like [Clytia hemisphaerica]|uniref:calcium and integrin-binding family member 2-like n=1 Tax=Clytia hemisphaerica TaxID=252671 RepID=UPI0034D3E48B|eukprot:TCONS_00037613-protein
MGSSHSAFTMEELKEYQELTYFTQKEILHCYKRFEELDPDIVTPMNKNPKLPQKTLLKLPELAVNPFRDRICKVFSSTNDGNMTFEDFLDMMSVLSPNAPKSVKVEYAFRVYDFNEDDYICQSDLERVIQRLCGYEDRLSNEDTNLIISNVFKEADLDGDDKLSFGEFEHVIAKSPDFLNSFRVRV